MAAAGGFLSASAERESFLPKRCIGGSSISPGAGPCDLFQKHSVESLQA